MPKRKSDVQPIGGEAAGDWRSIARRIEVEVVAMQPEGSRLPTEVALAARLGVNRYALRKAVAALVNKGVLRAVPHVGSFVAPSRITIAVAPGSSAKEALLKAGLAVASEVVSQRTCLPPAPIARRLGVALRTNVIEIVQRTTTNGKWFSQVTTWLPADRFDRIAALVSAAGSVSAALGQLGVTGTRCKAINVLTRPVRSDEAAVLELSASASVLVIHSLNVDQTGEPTHLSQCVVDAARIELAIEL